MAEVNGQLSSCDRCGAQIFRKTTGEGEADGGFTRWNKFEPYPEGWGVVVIPVTGRPYSTDHIRVCPDCHRLWQSALNEHFLKGSELYLKEV